MADPQRVFILSSGDKVSVPDDWNDGQIADLLKRMENTTAAHAARQREQQIYADAARASTPQGSAFSRGMGAVGQELDLGSKITNALYAAAHPVDTATAVAGQMGDEWSKAGQDFTNAVHRGVLLPKSDGQGGFVAPPGILDVISGLGHAAAGTIPVFGPAAAAAGEEIGRGDIAGGLVHGAATAAQAAAPTIAQGLFGKTVAPTIDRGAATMWRSAADAGTPGQALDILHEGMGPLVSRNTMELAQSTDPAIRALVSPHAAGVARAANASSVINASNAGALPLTAVRVLSHPLARSYAAQGLSSLAGASPGIVGWLARALVLAKLTGQVNPVPGEQGQ